MVDCTNDIRSSLQLQTYFDAAAQATSHMLLTHMVCLGYDHISTICLQHAKQSRRIRRTATDTYST